MVHFVAHSAETGQQGYCYGVERWRVKKKLAHFNCFCKNGPQGPMCKFPFHQKKWRVFYRKHEPNLRLKLLPLRRRFLVRSDPASSSSSSSKKFLFGMKSEPAYCVQKRLLQDTLLCKCIWFTRTHQWHQETRWFAYRSQYQPFGRRWRWP